MAANLQTDTHLSGSRLSGRPSDSHPSSITGLEQISMEELFPNLQNQGQTQAPKVPAQRQPNSTAPPSRQEPPSLTPEQLAQNQTQISNINKCYDITYMKKNEQKTRIPSYCDRILGGSIGKYKLIATDKGVQPALDNDFFKLSDHNPIVGEFKLVLKTHGYGLLDMWMDTKGNATAASASSASVN
jgi:hypothetical protein